ncbi:MAG: rod shape-determining protein RodA [Rikenella sp.]|nr:rod shape-determining protein RodA [Rikenella sp.]
MTNGGNNRIQLGFPVGDGGVKSGNRGGAGGRLFASDIDWWTVGTYVVMVFFGWLNIYAAVYNEEQTGIFDLSQRYGMQMLWICISLSLAVSILLIDGKYWHMLAYPFYFAMLGVMLFVLFFGHTSHGAQSWLAVGRIKIQPVEFMKFVTALALARYMSAYDFNLRTRKAIYNIGLIVGIPVLLILGQNDTGSAMVFGAFLFMLYREGLGAGLYVVGLMLVFLFIISFLLEPLPILFIVLGLCLAAQAVANRNARDTIRYLALVLLLGIAVFGILSICGVEIGFYRALIVGTVLSAPWIVHYAMRHHLPNLWKFVALFAGAIVFTGMVDYVFDNVLQLHQQKRILDLLGIENDPHGWSYNVIQSKIAIGSGGVLGKGFLGGTQTRFSFVPEQSTDFIFCTVGEEWGFLGAIGVVALFVFLILRLMRMGERQKEPFGRIYCYSVAAIIFVHFTINIAMTVGLFPVVGIPLPFFSYGGSSLLAFTLLLFVAVRLDASQYDETARKLL